MFANMCAIEPFLILLSIVLLYSSTHPAKKEMCNVCDVKNDVLNFYSVYASLFDYVYLFYNVPFWDWKLI